jgi:charged multivesicular body protein 4
MNLFGKKKAAPAPKLNDSIQQLREAQTMLDKREKHLEKQMQVARDQAKDKLKAKDKRGALFLLKRAKLYETQISQIYGKRQNIDMQVGTIMI